MIKNKSFNENTLEGREKRQNILKVINPYDVNKDLVDDTLQLVRTGHTISDFEFKNQYGDTITQLDLDGKKVNEQTDLQRDQWNASNAQAIEQSNVQWRRQANTADTAAANAANQQNVQNAYNISALDQTQMWQQLRDEAAYVRQSYENNEQREAQLIATAIGNEGGSTKGATTSTASLLDLIKGYI